MHVSFQINPELSADDFIDILNRSSLGERRPVDDTACMQAMAANADLTVCAVAEGRIVGIARSVTDFSYCCYLSDLAVDRAYQRRGIGRALIAQTQAQLGPKCRLILLSAPAATAYYPKIGFSHHPQAWIIGSTEPLA